MRAPLVGVPCLCEEGEVEEGRDEEDARRDAAVQQAVEGRYRGRIGSGRGLDRKKVVMRQEKRKGKREAVKLNGKNDVF